MNSIWPLSGKPFFYIILTKSQVKPIYQLGIPAKLYPVLPPGSIPTVLTIGSKIWEMMDNGTNRLKQFDRPSWGAFVNANDLKAGDGCVFELMECSSAKLVFRVQILRGDIPAELLENCIDKLIFVKSQLSQAEDTEMADSAQSSANPIIELHGDEFWPLSGRPFFDIILTKSHVKPIYQMEIPTKLDPELPAGTSVPMVLTFGDKSWEMTYNGTKRLKLVDPHSWRAFVDDNNLKAGDGCIFELTGCDSNITNVLFRVQILRGDIPVELVEKYSSEAEKPIVI